VHCSEVKALREVIVKLHKVNNQMKVRILDLEKEEANLQRIDEPNERTKKNDEGELKLLVKVLFSSIEKRISKIKVSIEEKVTENIEEVAEQGQCESLHDGMEIFSGETYNKEKLTKASPCDDMIYKEHKSEDNQSKQSDSSSTLNEVVKRRCKNAILYGLKEEESELEDQKTVLHMLQTIDVQCTPRKLYRLGRKEPNKIRPIKLIMSEKKEKHEIIVKFRLKSRTTKISSYEKTTAAKNETK
jgi:hypothetical protein